MKDDLIPFGKVPHHVPVPPGQKKRVSIATIWRWRTRGIAGVRLPVHHVGGRVYVSAAELALFFEQVQAAKEGSPIPTRTNKQRRRSHDAAEKALAAEGI